MNFIGQQLATFFQTQTEKHSWQIVATLLKVIKVVRPSICAINSVSLKLRQPDKELNAFSRQAPNGEFVNPLPGR